MFSPHTKKYTDLSLFLLWCSAVWGFEIKRMVVVGNVTIFALHWRLPRCHSWHLRILLLMEPLLVTHVLPIWKSPKLLFRCLWAPGMTEKPALSVTVFSSLQIKSSISSLPCSLCSHWVVSRKYHWRCFFSCFYPSWAGCCGCTWSVIGRHSRRCQLCTVCRQYIMGVLCGHCVSYVQICDCVSRLVCLRLLSVSKFCLCQSMSTVTKSLSSPADASFSKLKRNVNSCVFMYWTATRILHWDTTDILILQLLIGHIKQCMFPS